MFCPSLARSAPFEHGSTGLSVSVLYSTKAFSRSQLPLKSAAMGTSAGLASSASVASCSTGFKSGQPSKAGSSRDMASASGIFRKPGARTDARRNIGIPSAQVGMGPNRTSLETETASNRRTSCEFGTKLYHVPKNMQAQSGLCQQRPLPLANNAVAARAALQQKHLCGRVASACGRSVPSQHDLLFSAAGQVTAGVDGEQRCPICCRQSGFAGREWTQLRVRSNGENGVSALGSIGCAGSLFVGKG